MGVFKKRKNKNSSDFSHISEDMVITGDIDFSEAFEVLGTVKGKISADKDESELALRNGSKVIGDVYVPLISIDGEVEGNVHGNRIELASEAVIKGDIHYNVLEMSQGARVEGKMIHSDKLNLAKKTVTEPVKVNFSAEADSKK